MFYATLAGGFFVSTIFMVLLMPSFIRFLHKINYRQQVSEYSLQEFKDKAKTPTMGGILFVIIPVVVLLVIYPEALNDLRTVIVIMAYFGYGLIGFIDDYIIVIQKNNRGLPAKYKFALQLLLAILFYFIYRGQASLAVTIPFINVSVDLGGFYVVLVYFMFTGTSNAVNLTDGMDGLAAGTSFLALSPFVFFALTQHQYYIACFVLCIMGALLGYLKFNMFPAKIFMGDAGALALGGLLAALAMVLKQEIALVIIGGVFVWETMTCIIQIASVKLFKRRVFKYTPIHYSFKISGMSEPKIVLMFWLIGFVFAVLGFVIGVM